MQAIYSDFKKSYTKDSKFQRQSWCSGIVNKSSLALREASGRVVTRREIGPTKFQYYFSSKKTFKTVKCTGEILNILLLSWKKIAQLPRWYSEVQSFIESEINMLMLVHCYRAVITLIVSNGWYGILGLTRLVNTPLSMKLKIES